MSFTALNTMDLFENKRQKQAEQFQRQELKVQQIKQKLNDADKLFFKDEEEDKVNSILRKDLLVFQAKELKTVFSDDPDLDGNDTLLLQKLHVQVG